MFPNSLVLHDSADNADRTGEVFSIAVPFAVQQAGQVAFALAWAMTFSGGTNPKGFVKLETSWDGTTWHVASNGSVESTVEGGIAGMVEGIAIGPYVRVSFSLTQDSGTPTFTSMKARLVAKNGFNATQVSG